MTDSMAFKLLDQQSDNTAGTDTETLLITT